MYVTLTMMSAGSWIAGMGRSCSVTLCGPSKTTAFIVFDIFKTFFNYAVFYSSSRSLQCNIMRYDEEIEVRLGALMSMVMRNYEELQPG